MRMSFYPRHGRGRTTLCVAGWLLLVGLGIGLTWYGFVWIEENDQIAGTPSPVPVSAQATARPADTAPPSPTLPSAPTRTATPSSTITPEPTAIPATATAEAEPPSTGDEAWPAEVFRLINQVRAGHGLPPYTYDETLERAAQLHGQDCQQRGGCSHTGSDGSNVETRIRRAGYDAVGWSEVLVYSSSPQAAVDWWMDEIPPDDPHRSTLLSTWVTEIGIAVVPTGRGDYYFIADFGRPRTP
jgi:uncharacterized protein YkwD